MNKTLCLYLDVSVKYTLLGKKMPLKLRLAQVFVVQYVQIEVQT